MSKVIIEKVSETSLKLLIAISRKQSKNVQKRLN